MATKKQRKAKAVEYLARELGNIHWQQANIGESFIEFYMRDSDRWKRKADTVLSKIISLLTTDVD